MEKKLPQPLENIMVPCRTAQLMIFLSCASLVVGYAQGAPSDEFPQPLSALGALGPGCSIAFSWKAFRASQKLTKTVRNVKGNFAGIARSIVYRNSENQLASLMFAYSAGTQWASRIIGSPDLYATSGTYMAVACMTYLVVSGVRENFFRNNPALGIRPLRLPWQGKGPKGPTAE